MAHWAELDENNLVLRVVVGNNEDPNGDEGYQWLIDNLGGNWIKTSYNARRGNRIDPVTFQPTGEKAFRGNFAGIGYTYYPDLDIFMDPKPFPSYVLDEENCAWVAPVAPPDDGSDYIWNEDTLTWDSVTPIVPEEV